MIINLMPRVVRVYTEDRPDGMDDIDSGLLRTLDPEPQSARLTPLPIGTTYLDDLPVELVEYGHVDNLPASRDGVSYVVPIGVALSQAARRDDLLVPYRDVTTADGTVIGCRELAQPI